MKISHYYNELVTHTKNYKSVQVMVGKELHVTPSEVFMEEIKTFLGKDCCKLVL